MPSIHTSHFPAAGKSAARCTGPDGGSPRVGGRSRWWQTPEQKVARFLQSCGHRVLFIDTGGRSSAGKQAAA